MLLGFLYSCFELKSLYYFFIKFRFVFTPIPKCFNVNIRWKEVV